NRARAVKVDLQSDAGVAAALRSPAQSVRYLGWQQARGRGAVIASLLGGDDVSRARALWLADESEARKALADPDPRFRILAIRILEWRGADLVETTRALWRDPSPQVRREIAVSLRDARSEAAVDALLELSRQYDGRDRWYLEALGIGARGKENALYARLRKDYMGPHLFKLLWEFRPPDALPQLISSAPVDDRALEALAAMPQAEAGRAVAAMGQKGFEKLSVRLFSEWVDLRKDPAVVAAIRAALQSGPTQMRALELADELEDPQYGPELLDVARSAAASEEARGAAIQALGKTRDARHLPLFEQTLKSAATPLRVRAVRAIASVRPANLDPLILSGQQPNEVRSEAVRMIGRSDRGAAYLLDLEQQQRLPAELRNVATSVVNSNRNPAVRARAAKLLPPFSARNKDPLPPPRMLLSQEGNAARGKLVFESSEGPKCDSCHGSNKAGPDLARIGGKLDKEALLDSILNPSAGIAPEFYQWILQTKTQGEVIGVIAEDTPQRVTVLTENGDEIRLKPVEITARRRSRLSMMPEDLVNQMAEQELVDLLEYLTTLR
ncbi:MAG: HEAT repeat domain-containing protein, partial [Bryobacteraceae bacterium]